MQQTLEPGEFEGVVVSHSLDTGELEHATVRSSPVPSAEGDRWCFRVALMSLKLQNWRSISVLEPEGGSPAAEHGLLLDDGHPRQPFPPSVDGRVDVGVHQCGAIREHASIEIDRRTL